MNHAGAYVKDVRLALRGLFKRSCFALTAITNLALGVAASLAIFAFVDTILVKPLPYQDPSRPMAIFESITPGEQRHLSPGDYREWRQENHSFVSLDVYEPESAVIRESTGLSQVQGARVSDGFFRTLGVALPWDAIFALEKTAQALHAQ